MARDFRPRVARIDLDAPTHSGSDGTKRNAMRGHELERPELRRCLVEKLEQRAAAFSSSGREAVPRYRAQATHRRAVPLYTAESVKNSEDFPTPSELSFATVVERLQLRSLPPTTRPNVSPAGEIAVEIDTRRQPPYPVTRSV
eukprot:g15873.t1